MTSLSRTSFSVSVGLLLESFWCQSSIIKVCEDEGDQCVMMCCWLEKC